MSMIHTYLRCTLTAIMWPVGLCIIGYTPTPYPLCSRTFNSFKSSIQEFKNTCSKYRMNKLNFQTNQLVQTEVFLVMLVTLYKYVLALFTLYSLLISNIYHLSE